MRVILALVCTIMLTACIPLTPTHPTVAPTVATTRTLVPPMTPTSTVESRVNAQAMVAPAEPGLDDIPVEISQTSRGVVITVVNTGILFSGDESWSGKGYCGLAITNTNPFSVTFPLRLGQVLTVNRTGIEESFDLATWYYKDNAQGVEELSPGETWVGSVWFGMRQILPQDITTVKLLLPTPIVSDMDSRDLVLFVVHVR